MTQPRRWTVVEMIKSTAEYLAGKNFHNPRLNAELLLAGMLGLKRLDLYLQHDRPLTPEELDEFRSRLRRRARREPLQYIDGTAAFRDLVLHVDGRVLIPRPETEVLVQHVLDWAAKRAGEERALSAVDLGTGSGAIALALATEGPFRRVVATDVDRDTLRAARDNHGRTAPESPVEFRPGDLWRAVGDERFDVVVSNPPYIGEDERAAMDTEVVDWEPAGALFAGPDGLRVIRPLVAGAADHLEEGGLLALEMGAAQGAAVCRLIEQTNAFGPARVLPDLAGRDRVVLAERR
ncbi:peptide chain release factor N(5)-glutamine methyltransferase [Longimicrobium terrae]|uniref:Release factor glutamine methyltransferase n=1 Tax=Longimicrobium terrae TaxID=1639882 RepID=A0A841GRK7_9BACT|nr:release factor glutamine methyltransferase [Longimicrobium terrae]MBB6070252.1 release factor glutamine methyltransferase [Longimicrobium terrae]NNC30756.1 peptide chain release factor N(5)-glutamine methyltransferase [Longimicrobium terrae]